MDFVKIDVDLKKKRKKEIREAKNRKIKKGNTHWLIYFDKSMLRMFLWQ